MNTLFIGKKVSPSLGLMAMKRVALLTPQNNRSSTLYNRMNIKYIYLHTFKRAIIKLYEKDF